MAATVRIYCNGSVIAGYLNIEARAMIDSEEIVFDKYKKTIRIPTLDDTKQVNISAGKFHISNKGNNDDLEGEYTLIPHGLIWKLHSTSDTSDDLRNNKSRP